MGLVSEGSVSEGSVSEGSATASTYGLVLESSLIEAVTSL